MLSLELGQSLMLVELFQCFILTSNIVSSMGICCQQFYCCVIFNVPAHVTDACCTNLILRGYPLEANPFSVDVMSVAAYNAHLRGGQIESFTVTDKGWAVSGP